MVVARSCRASDSRSPYSSSFTGSGSKVPGTSSLMASTGSLVIFDWTQDGIFNLSRRARDARRKVSVPPIDASEIQDGNCPRRRLGALIPRKIVPAAEVPIEASISCIHYLVFRRSHLRIKLQTEKPPLHMQPRRVGF